MKRSLLGLAFISALVVQGVAAEATTNLPPFRVTTSVQPVPGAVPVMRGFVFTETNRYSFILPPGMRLQPEPENRKVFLISNDGYAISMQATAPGSSLVPLKTEGLAEQVVARFSGGKLVSESIISVGGQGGPAYDVLWRSATGQLITRVGFVPVPGGFLEFNFTSPADKFQAQQLLLNRFLLSFRRSGATGELSIVKVEPPE